MATLLYTKKRAVLGALELDVSISETHEGPVDVTEFPVEEGFDIADHARAKAETVTIEGFVSNTPIPFDGEAALTQTEQYPYGRGVVEFESKSKALISDSEENSPATQAYNLLRGMREEGQIFTLVTSLRTYENMVLTNLSVPRNASAGNGLHFTASLKQVRVVQAQDGVRVVSLTEDKVKPKAKLEKKAADSGPRKTVAAAVFDVAVGLLQ